MNHEIYIITRQMRYESRGVRHAIEENNPVVAVFETLSHAIECVERLTANYDESRTKTEVTNHHSSVGLMLTYVCKDVLDQVDVAYNIVHETVLS